MTDTMIFKVIGHIEDDITKTILLEKNKRLNIFSFRKCPPGFNITKCKNRFIFSFKKHNNCIIYSFYYLSCNTYTTIIILQGLDSSYVQKNILNDRLNVVFNKHKNTTKIPDFLNFYKWIYKSKILIGI